MVIGGASIFRLLQIPTPHSLHYHQNKLTLISSVAVYRHQFIPFPCNSHSQWSLCTVQASVGEPSALLLSSGFLEMPASVSNISSSMKINKETELLQKQGIVTILGSDCDHRNTATASSLRRTLSADMSSKKWLSQNGFSDSPLKKCSSAGAISHSEINTSNSLSSSEAEDDYKEMKEQKEDKTVQFNLWSSILSQKANDDITKSLTTPYIHPLVKRSQSTLSEKSLQICTESLGSETGSDGFSSYPPSETGDSEEDKEEEESQQQEKVTAQPCEAEEELFQVPKYNSAAASKKSKPQCFPPLIPSLSNQAGPSVHMRSHRDNGRLVLEAVSVPAKNNFRAERLDGRLVLTFSAHSKDEETMEDAEEFADEESENDHMEDEFGEYKEDDDEEKEYEEEDEDDQTVMDEAPILSSEFSSVKKFALMMNKPIRLVNRNPKWLDKSDEAVNFEDVNVQDLTLLPLPASLPPRPRVARLIPAASAAAAVASFNDYQYRWKSKPTTKTALFLNSKLLTHQQCDSALKNNSSKLFVFEDFRQTSSQQQMLVILRGKNGDYKWQNCKEPRRSYLFWEPYCIATS